MNSGLHANLVKGFVATGITRGAVAGPAAAMPVVPSSAQVGNSQLLTDVQFRGWATTVSVIVVSVPTDFIQSIYQRTHKRKRKMKLSTQSVLLKSLLAIGVTTTLAGCVSDGYGDGPGVAVGVGVYDGGMHHHHMYTHWDRRLHGNRCRVAYGNCNRFYGGYYYESPWWTMSY